MLRSAAVMLAAALIFGVSGAGAIDLWPPPPANLRMVSSQTDSITIGWGPTVTGDFLSAGGTQHSVTVAWEPASDPNGIDHYTVEQYDGTLWGTTTGTSFTHGIPRRALSVHVCVFATNALGQDGPRRCGVYSR